MSDELCHNASTVLAFTGKLLTEIIVLVPNVSCIHYITDSPTSQYRNKVILQFVAFHQDTMQIRASWLYLESGHGKCPCDGVGGTAKRLADDAV